MVTAYPEVFPFESFPPHGFLRFLRFLFVLRLRGKKKLKDAARKQRAGNTVGALEQAQRKSSNANKQKPGIQKVRTETFS